MKPFHYTGCGLDNVYLVNGYKIKNTPYGEAVAIEDIEGLHKAIGRYLVRHKHKLDGKEIRFLRHQMEMSQRTVGEIFGKQDQTIANWEKGKTKIPRTEDTLFRKLFLEYVQEQSEVRDLVDKMNHIEKQEYHNFCAELDDGWHLKSA